MIGAGSTYNPAAAGGSADAIVPSHTHTITDPGHFHSQTGYTTGVPQSNGANQYSVVTPYSLNTGTATTGISINTAGVSPVGTNMPPYYALCYIIKT